MSTKQQQQVPSQEMGLPVYSILDELRGKPDMCPELLQVLHIALIDHVVTQSQGPVLFLLISLADDVCLQIQKHARL